jgi:hypothetical protein
VAFERGAERIERNSVSIAPFRITRTSLSGEKVASILARAGRAACGTRLLSLVANAATWREANQFAREFVDVVVSIGHVVDVPTPDDLNLACAFVPCAARPYAVYVNCIVLHGLWREAVANVTYSFSCAADAAPLLAQGAVLVFCT